LKPGPAIVALYALLAALVVPVYPHFPSPNEFTRWALVASVVDFHTIEVSRAVAILGSIEDLAVVDGRVYSNKAPGAALVAAPGYLLVRPFIGPPSRQNLRVALTAMRWFGATLPLLLLGLMFRERPLAVAALLFATPLFAYGLLLFSHALVAAALFGAWWLLYEWRPSPGLRPPSPRSRGEGQARSARVRGATRPILAGVLLGIAVSSEYPMIIPAAVLVAFAPWRSWWKIAAGGAPFAILLALYQKAAFGSVFASPYTYEKLPEYRQLAHTGLFGIQPPSLSILLHTLFDPARGLLLFAPIVIAGVVGLRHVRLPRPAFLTLLLVPLSILAIYSGYPNWHGGWNVGPRYVVSAIPFLLFPIVFASERIVTPILLGMSAATVVPLTLTFPFPDRTLPLPWATLAWPLLRDGLVAPNLLHFAARPLAIAVPFAIVIAALAIATRKRIALVAAGVAVTLIVSALAARPTMTDHLRVTYIEEVFFERPGPPMPPRAEARARRELTQPPASWPF
jgi:hypothetical protein